MKALYAGYGAVLGIWRYKLGCGAVLVNTALCWCKGRCVGVHGVQGAAFGDGHLCGGRLGPGGLARICPPRDDARRVHDGTRIGQGADEPGAGGLTQISTVRGGSALQLLSLTRTRALGTRGGRDEVT